MGYRYRVAPLSVMKVLWPQKGQGEAKLNHDNFVGYSFDIHLTGYWSSASWPSACHVSFGSWSRNQKSSPFQGVKSRRIWLRRLCHGLEGLVSQNGLCWLCSGLNCCVESHWISPASGSVSGARHPLLDTEMARRGATVSSRMVSNKSAKGSPFLKRWEP